MANRVLAVLLLGLSLTPLAWLAVVSLQRRVDALAVPPRLIFRPTIQNYIAAFSERGVPLALSNSFIVATLSTLVAMTTGAAAAYWISRSQRRWRGTLLEVVFAFRLLPAVGLLLPLYLWMRSIGLLDSRAGLVLVHAAVNVVFVIWMLSAYFDDIPSTYEDIARTDGCESGAQLLIGIVLPLARPGLLVTAAFTFLASWNEFLFAMILAPYNGRTLTVLVPGLVTPQGTYWGQVAAIAVVTCLPAAIGVGLMRRHLVRGALLGFGGR